MIGLTGRGQKGKKGRSGFKKNSAKRGRGMGGRKGKSTLGGQTSGIGLWTWLAVQKYGAKGKVDHSCKKEKGLPKREERKKKMFGRKKRSEKEKKREEWHAGLEVQDGCMEQTEEHDYIRTKGGAMKETGKMSGKRKAPW